MNAPQLMPALEKKLFRKESLELLQRMISAIGLVLEQCYITNMIKCEPSTALVQPSAMYAHCSEILEHELKLLSPRAVLVMGDMLPLARCVNATVRCPGIVPSIPLPSLKTRHSNVPHGRH
jgi:uracil-DNA glycosylase family 4